MRTVNIIMGFLALAVMMIISFSVANIGMLIWLSTMDM